MRLMIAAGLALISLSAAAQSMSCTTIGSTTNCFIHKGIDLDGPGSFAGGLADGLAAGMRTYPSEPPAPILVVPRAYPKRDINAEAKIDAEFIRASEEFERGIRNLHMDPAVEAKILQEAKQTMLKGRDLEIEIERSRH